MMFRGYDISKDFDALCCDDFCNLYSDLFKKGVSDGEKMWKELESDDKIKVTRYSMSSFDNNPVTVIVLEPQNVENKAPCLVYYHGGGFIIGLMEYHLNAIRNYVLGAKCKVVCVDYRLAPEYPFPTAVKDAYETLLWTVKNAEMLDIDVNRIAVGGDSAGGNLTAVITQIARDNNGPQICFQMMNYPYTDSSMSSESNKKFTDTPVWNSEASKIMASLLYKNGYAGEKKAYASPIEAEDFSNLPKAYVEVSEFDCLRDEGLAYAQKLKDAGVETEVVETERTVHAYDFIADCDTTKKYMKMRVDALKRGFNVN